MTIEEQVNDGIKNAMKAHDKVRLETMRNIKKVILEAKTRPGANERIDDAECIRLIQKLAKQGKESAEIYRQQGREDLYEQESGQVAFPSITRQASSKTNWSGIIRSFVLQKHTVLTLKPCTAIFRKTRSSSPTAAVLLPTARFRFRLTTPHEITSSRSTFA